MSMTDIGAEIVRHLGEEYFVDRTRTVGPGSVWIGNRVKDAQFGIIVLHNQETNRIYVDGVWPEAIDNETFHWEVIEPGEGLFIHMTDRATPSQIAKKIEIEFLPRYCEVFAVAAKKRDEHNAGISSRNNLAREFEILSGGTKKGFEIIGSSEEGGFVRNIRVHQEDDVEILFRGLTAKDARKLLVAWNTIKAGREA